MKCKIILGLIILSLFLDKVNAQERKSRFDYIDSRVELQGARYEAEEESFYGGMEIGTTKDYRSFIQMGVWLQSDRDYYRLRIAGSIDQPFELKKRGDEQKNSNSSQSKAVYDCGFIYGKHISISKKHFLQFGSGISIIQKVDPDEIYNASKQPGEPLRFRERSAIGLPLEVKYGFRFYQNFELIGSINSNVNRLKSYTGISIGFAASFF